MQYIIDRDQVNMAATNGNAEAATSIWAATSPVYVDDGITLDVDKGLKILKDAGYEPSDISFDIAVVADDTFKAAAENVQAQLLAVGMNVTVTTGDFATVNEKRASGNYEALIIDTGANTYAPLRAVSALLISNAPEMYNGLAVTEPELQAEIDEMLVTAQAAPTAEEANELGRELTQKYQENFTMLPLIQKNSYHLYNSKVQGLYYESSSGFGKFQDAYWVE